MGEIIQRGISKQEADGGSSEVGEEILRQWEAQPKWLKDLMSMPSHEERLRREEEEFHQELAAQVASGEISMVNALATAVRVKDSPFSQ